MKNLHVILIGGSAISLMVGVLAGFLYVAFGVVEPEVSVFAFLGYAGLVWFADDVIYPRFGSTIEED